MESLESMLIGVSQVVVRLRRDIAKIAPTGISVLIEGETGTGKELVSSALHRLSGRRGAFVPVNVAAIPESLFESHVFGHCRGAFTGAVTDHRGYVDEARAGTLLLDEISSAPIAGQAKLLRVLESGQVRPVGARADRPTDFRLIAAANASLHIEVAAKRFRPDLLYRLCGDLLIVPPLRAREGDVEPLAQHFASRLATRLGRRATLTKGALRVLDRYEWPGNVRQLKTVVERTAVGAESDELHSSDVKAVLERLAPRVHHEHQLGAQAAELQALLERNSWDTSRVAAELGITRKTVYSRIQRYDLHIPGKHTRRVGPSHSDPLTGQVPGDARTLSIVPSSDAHAQQQGVA
jgi:DNA-binding NtrC family response regulator